MKITQASKYIAVAIISILAVSALAYAFNAGFDESRYFSGRSLDVIELVLRREKSGRYTVILEHREYQ